MLFLAEGQISFAPLPIKGDYMKKIRFIFTSVFISAILIFSSLSSAFAATYFSDGNFTFMKNGDGTITITEYNLKDGNMVVPEKIFGDTVVAVKMMAFYQNNYIVSASFPDTLTSIGDAAFYKASNLQSVVIPANCLNVGIGALQNCSSLKNVEIKSQLTEIADQVFYNCSSLETIEIPSTVESIGSFAFSDCSSLKALTIPKATTSIASNAFRNCPNLTLYVYKDSYAHQFAVEKSIKYEIIPEHEIGDIDMNGIVNISDATLIQQYAVSIKELSDYQLSLADVNGDGVVNVLDATQIQRILVGFA